MTVKSLRDIRRVMGDGGFTTVCVREIASVNGPYSVNPELERVEGTIHTCGRPKR